MRIHIVGLVLLTILFISCSAEVPQNQPPNNTSPSDTDLTQSLNTNIISGKLLQEINERRATRPLRFNERLSKFAKDRSIEVVNFGGYSSEIKDIDEKLSNERFFSLWSYELSLISSNILDSEDAVVEEAISIWMSNPTYRSLIIDSDGVYSDVGASVYYHNGSYYSTVIFSSLIVTETINSESNLCWSRPLYDVSHPIDTEILVSIKIKSNNKIHAWIAKDKEGFESCIQNNMLEKDAVRDYSFITTLDDKVKIKKGNILVFRVNDEASFNWTIDYGQE